ncbi:hypothetical protein FDENT_9172 [Fusarium denticulatum]|uniref:Uncharacterized protein n=1 Tax=Fusarium denticulatum TaxID=48507 RepID=A0A8H5X1E1_9HYPO|nr:hypothetical protein FDENT_9172 [Fusarium denticulatum]
MEGQDALLQGSNQSESPYHFSTVKIIFGDNSIYWVPTYLLERYPKFRLSYNRDGDFVKLNWLNNTQTAGFMGYLRRGKWESQKPEDLNGPLDYYNRMQQCLSVHCLAVSYGMHELARLTIGEFSSMANRLSIFSLAEMLHEVSSTLQSNQTVSADYSNQRVTMSEEAIMAELAGFQRLSLVEHSDNITPAEAREMKRKLQRYQERYGPL